MSEEEELQQLTKIDPKVVQTLLLFKMYRSLKKLEPLADKFGAYIKFMGPMTRMFKRELQYQYAPIGAGSSGRVWYMQNPQPDLLVGIIVQVANDWFADTYLEWYVDHHPKRVEYSIADINAPKHYARGIPFHDEVEWIAYNNDASDHVFGVLTDGFFMPRIDFEKITRDGKATWGKLR